MNRTNLTVLEELNYWRNDSAAAWDKCEERRLETEDLRAKLADAYRALDFQRRWMISKLGDFVCMDIHMAAFEAALDFVEAENKEKSDV